MKILFIAASHVAVAVEDAAVAVAVVAAVAAAAETPVAAVAAGLLLLPHLVKFASLVFPGALKQTWPNRS